MTVDEVTWQAIARGSWPILVAIIFGLAVRWLLSALARMAGKRAEQSLRARIALVVATPAAMALPLFFLSIAVAGTALPDAWIQRIQHWLGVGGLLCMTWLAVRATGAIERRIRREHPVDTIDNLRARRVQTQARVLGRVAQIAIAFIGISMALMTFPAIHLWAPRCSRRRAWSDWWPASRRDRSSAISSPACSLHLRSRSAWTTW